VDALESWDFYDRIMPVNSLQNVDFWALDHTKLKSLSEKFIVAEALLQQGEIIMTNIRRNTCYKTIVNEFLDDFTKNILDSDVVVVGSGPCGAAASKILRPKIVFKTVMIERISTQAAVCGRAAILCPRIPWAHLRTRFT